MVDSVWKFGFAEGRVIGARGHLVGFCSYVIMPVTTALAASSPSIASLAVCVAEARPHSPTSLIPLSPLPIQLLLQQLPNNQIPHPPPLPHLPPHPPTNRKPGFPQTSSTPPVPPVNARFQARQEGEGAEGVVGEEGEEVGEDFVAFV